LDIRAIPAIVSPNPVNNKNNAIIQILLGTANSEVSVFEFYWSKIYDKFWVLPKLLLEIYACLIPRIY